MRAGPGTEQWQCECGWSNFAVRKRCRNCNALSLAERIAAKAREIESQRLCRNQTGNEWRL